MNILIIGAGSIGSLFGAKIALTGQPVYAYISNRLIEKQKNIGLVLNDFDGKSHQISKFYPLKQSEEYSLDCKSTICIIATKTIHLENICTQYHFILNQVPLIALLQNGIGNEEIVSKYYPTIPILRIVTSNGALMPECGQVTHTGKGATIIGLSFNNLKISQNIIENFSNLLKKAGFDPVYSNEIYLKIWWKAFINIGINVFGAITRLKNGELVNIASIKDMMKLTLIEAYNVAINLIPKLDPVEKYISQLFDVVEKTAQNKNSMLQDILKNSKTEIQFLNGYIVKKGLELNIPTPLNALLTALIEGIESNFN